MQINERIRLLRRNHLELTQEQFASKIKISRSNLGSIEVGRINVTDRVIEDICSVFNVNENWLRTGEGEMFETLPKDELDKLAARYKLNPLAKKIVESFVTLEEHEMESVLKFVKNIAASVTYNELAVAKENYYNHSELVATTDNYINDEVEAYRLELEAERKGKTSSVSEDIKGPKAK